MTAPTTFARQLGQAIHRARMAAGMSQSALADRLLVHVQTVSTWERGTRVPTLARLQQIAAACGVPVSALLPAA